MNDTIKNTLAALDNRNIKYTIKEHEPVYTMDEMVVLGLDHDAVITKNLFIRDDKKRNYFLIVLTKEKQLNFKALQKTMNSRPLRFASENDLTKYLGLIKGAVSPLGILNDENRTVQVLFDEDLKNCTNLGVHPNDNTATVYLAFQDLCDLIKEHGNEVGFITITNSDEN